MKGSLLFTFKYACVRLALKARDDNIAISTNIETITESTIAVITSNHTNNQTAPIAAYPKANQLKQLTVNDNDDVEIATATRANKT